METIELTREQLYDIVWSTPVSKLVEKYALSRDGIKALCKKYEISIPVNGYWSKLKFNKPVKKIQLNNTYTGADKIVLTIREEGLAVNLDQTPLSILTKQIENVPKDPFTIPDKLTKPDILIQNTIDIFNKRKKERFYNNEKIDSVSINVEDVNFDRALRIMDTFIKLLRHRGHTFRKDRNDYGPHIVVNDVEFPFYLREAQKRIPPITKYGSSTYLPTGVLVLKIGESYKSNEWKDGSVKLDMQLAKIVAKMELEAEKELQWREECRLHAIQRAEEEKIKKELKARKEKEVAKTKKLFSEAEIFNKATIYRNYIKKIEQKAILENKLTDELKDWIKWANDKSDWLDPLINKEDEFFDEDDIEDLVYPKQTKNYYRY